jgi:hypothetical protein
MVLKDVGFEGVDWVHLDRIGGNGGLLWTRQWTLGFHKMQVIAYLSDYH